jgi:hypothetical protein
MTFMDPSTAHILLDVDRMAALIGHLGLFRDASVTAVELAATWVKPGRYFNAHYRVSHGASDMSPTSVSAFIVDAARGRRVVDKAGPHSCANQPKQSCAACNSAYLEPGILLQTFPRDYRLPTLSHCLSSQRVREASSGSVDPVACEVIAYRPGMRCQIKYSLDEDRAVFGKLSVEKRGRGHAFGVHRALFEELSQRTQHLRLPEPMMYVDRLGLSLIAAAQGESLASVARSNDRGVREVARVAASLAELHGVDSSITTRAHPPDSELELLTAWTRLISAMYPTLGGRIGAGLQSLSECMPEPAAAPALLHMDTASLGDRELDVANFCVHTWLRGVQHGSQQHAARLSESFLAAYPEALDARRLAWYRRATLLRLAGNYALRPRWGHVVEPIMDEAERGERSR